MTKQVI